MAAIIAQITYKNWERIKKQRLVFDDIFQDEINVLMLREGKFYSATKSTYELPPFDASFNPWKHNRYFVRKRKASLAELEKRVDDHISRLVKAQRKKIIWKPYTLNRCLCESVIVILCLTFVPVLWIWINFYWPE